MIDPGLLDETYVMNLLGHLKLANERGCPAGEEYFTASTLLKLPDANNRLRNELTFEFLEARTPPRDWPDVFRKLRQELDQAYAPDPDDLGPAVSPVTSVQLLDFLVQAKAAALAQNLGVPIHDLFDWKRIGVYLGRPNWNICCRQIGDLNTIRDTIREAPRHIGDADLLEWFVDVLMSVPAKTAAREKLQRPLLDYLRGAIVEPREAQQRLADARAIGHGYGNLDGFSAEFLPEQLLGTLDRLSYAALERRLVRILRRVEEFGKSLLEDCESICPRLREALEQRVAATLELDGNVQVAVALLTGQPRDGDESASEVLRRVTGFQQSVQEPGGLQSLLAQRQQPPGTTRREQPAASGERLSDWADVQLEWNADARHQPFAAPVAVRREQEASGIAKVLQRLKLKAGRPTGLEVLAGPAQERVLCIYGLDPRREDLLRVKLPAAAEAAKGDTIEERLCHAVLGDNPAQKASAEAMVAVPHYEVQGDIPPVARALFEQALEIFDPRPLTEHNGDVMASLSAHAVKQHQLLETGDCLFRCGKSLADLLAELGSQ